MAERLLYLPSLGFSIFVVALGKKTLAGISQKRHIFFSYSLLTVILLLVFLYTIRTVRRNMDWKDEAHLFNSVIRNAPESARGHNQMAAVYFQNGNYQMALKEAKRAVEIHPDYKEAHYSLGTTYNKMGKYDKAVIELTRAISIHPRYPSALLNLGNSYHYLKQYDKAVKIYKDLISIRPDYAEAYNNLGISYYFKGMVDEAIKAYLRALELKQDYAEVCKNLGVLYYRKKGDIQRSTYYLERSLEFDPRQPEAEQVRALIQFIKNKTTK
jgi:tetratricopeptide (TPR) repeat protein